MKCGRRQLPRSCRAFRGKDFRQRFPHMILIRTVCSMGMKCQAVGECYVKDGKVRYFSWREGAE